MMFINSAEFAQALPSLTQELDKMARQVPGLKVDRRILDLFWLVIPWTSNPTEFRRELLIISKQGDATQEREREIATRVLASKKTQEALLALFLKHGF